MWEIGVSNQAVTFLLSVLAGIVYCVFYDVLRALRKAGFNSFIATFITDIIYWVIIAFATFLFLLARTNGEIRGYVLLASLLGFVICRATFSKPLLKIMSFIMIWMVKILRLIHCGFYRFYDGFLLAFSKVSTKFVKSTRLTLKKLKKLLKNRYSMLYTKENEKTSRNGDG
ncbi:MAG: spore cortex biosynthesis protein YabQ [Clostridia bacterium]|nr:spore cortex biosynthesis protein YabQ [Clostridia bacterium]